MPKRVSRHEVEQPLDQNIKLIALTRGQNAIVDASDYDWLMQWNWHAFFHPIMGMFYARRCIIGLQKIGMHSIIMPCGKGFVPDHINGNTLDNRRSNLQRISHSLNLSKQKSKRVTYTGITGISWDKARKKYAVSFGKKHYGRFHSLEEAKKVRSSIVESAFLLENAKSG